MNCALSDSQIKNFRDYVVSDLFKKSEAENFNFNLDAYIKDMFGSLLAGGVDEDKSIAYVSLIPRILRNLFGVSKGNQLDFLIPYIPNMVRLERSFTDPKNVIDYLVPTSNTELAQELLKLRELQTIEDLERLNNALIFERVFTAKPLSFNTTTGQSENRLLGIPDEDRLHSYKFIEHLKNNYVGSNEDGSIEYRGNRLFISMGMAQTFVRESDTNAPPLRSGFVHFISDIKGTPIYFDNDYNVVDAKNGRLVFFRVREKLDSIETPAAIARATKLPVEDINRILNSQKSILDSKIQTLIRNPRAAIVHKILLGESSIGYVEISFSNYLPMRDSRLNPEEYNIQVNLETTIDSDTQKKKTKQNYLFVHKTNDFAVPFKMDTWDKNPEFIEKAVKLFTNNVYREEDGRLVLVSASDKLKFFKTYFNNLARNESSALFVESISKLYRDKDGNDIYIPELVFNIRNENKTVASFTTSEAIGNEQLIDILRQKLLYSSFRPKNFQTGEYDELVTKANTVNIVINYKQESEILDFTFIPDHPSGKLVVNKRVLTEDDYVEFVKNNSRTPSQYNSNGEFVPENGYFAFEILNESVVNKTNLEEEFKDSKKIPAIEQNFKDGFGGRKMLPENAGKSTFELILEGKRTRTTRSKTWVNSVLKALKTTSVEDIVGKVVKQTDADGNFTYTRITSVVPFTQEIQDETWQQEGWEKSVTDKLLGKYPVVVFFENLGPEYFKDFKRDALSIKPIEVSTDVDKISDDLLKDYEKLKAQKLINAEVTKEDIEAAREWYKNHPMSKLVPYNELFGILNPSNPNAVANFTKQGITLFKGSDATDVYHEAFHAFTQLFLKPEQRKNMYNSLRTLKGSFVTHEGNTVNFKDATDLEAEEYLAEEFRTYALNGGKKVSTKTESLNPVKSFFKKLFEILRMLFGETIESEVSDIYSSKTLMELFNNLHIGNLYPYYYDGQNAAFDVLNKIKAYDEEDLANNYSPSYTDTKVLVDSIDSLLVHFIDSLYVEKGKRFSSDVFSNPNILNHAYLFVKKSFETNRDQFLKELEKYTPGSVNYNLLAERINVLNYALRNFGDTSNPENVYENKGLIEYHLRKTKIFNLDDLLFDEEDVEDKSKTNAKDGYGHKSGNEVSMRERANREVEFLLRSVYKYEDGKPSYNNLGFKELLLPNIVYSRIQKELEGVYTPEQQYSKMLSSSESNFIVAQILNKLGDPASYSLRDDLSMFSLWTNFSNVFGGYRIKLIQLTLNQSNDKITSIQPGVASGEFDVVGRKWSQEFSNPLNTNPYIIKSKLGNSLDVEKVIADYLKNNRYLTDPYGFLKALGVDLIKSPVVIKSLKSGVFDEMLKEIMSRLVANKKKRYENLNLIIGTINTSPYKELQRLEFENSDEFNTAMVFNAAGDPQSELSLRSTVSQMIDYINQSNNETQLYSIPEMNHLDPNRNPGFKYSLARSILFDDAGFKQTLTKSNRVKQSGIQLLNSSGVKLLVDGVFTDTGIGSAEADETTYILQNMYLMLMYGVSEATRHSDKTTTYLYKLNQASGEKHYIPLRSFTRLINSGAAYYANDIDRNIKNSAAQRKLIETMFRYLAAELERISKLKQKDPAGNATVGSETYKEVGSDFIVFDGIFLDKTLRSEILKKFSKGEDFLTGIENDRLLKNKIITAIENYFDERVEEVRGLMNDSSVLNKSELMIPVRKLVKQNAIDVPENASLDQLDEIILRSYVYNDWIHKYESTVLFYGDASLYNRKKQEFHKRNSGVAATGTIPRTDGIMRSALKINQDVRKTAKSRYVDSAWYRESGLALPKDRVYDGTFNSSVLEDKEPMSKYVDEYINAALQKEKERLGRDLTEQEETLIKDIFNPYTKMTEADGQGWISFESYRDLLIMLGKWSKVQEALFNKIIQGVDVSVADIAKFFPVKKMQYFGPLKTEGLPLFAFHKFSVMPLIPTVIKGTNLETLHNKMVSQQIDYALMKSGSKVNTITKKGTVDKFYNNSKNDDRQVAFADPTYKFTPNTIFLNYYKDQTEVHDSFKKSIVFSTQLRKLIEEGIMENGVPTDWNKSVKNPNERIKLWNRVEDKEAASPLFSKLKTYERQLEKLTKYKKEELMREANIEEQPDGTLKINGTKLLDFVNRELTRQDIAEHELDFIKFGADSKSLVYDLSVHQQSDRIERLLNAIVYKRLIRQKVTGEALTQVSGLGFENPLRAATEAENKKYGTNGLSFYTQVKDAEGNVIETAAMKVKIAIQGEFKKLLKDKTILEYAEINDLTPLQALNRKLKDEKWLSKNREKVTIVGVRIPVQGLNSMEFAEVAEFLPEVAGNMIILPSEIVAKAGSDFDIDKLYMMFPSLSIVNGETILGTSSEDSDIDLKTIKDRIKEIKKELNVVEDRAERKVLFDELNDLKIKEVSASVKSIENDLIRSTLEIMRMPENFVELVTPNSNYILEPLATKYKKVVRKYDEYLPGEKVIRGTRVFEIGYNLYKQSSNNIGKKTLGIGAVDNTYNIIFNRVGAYLNRNVTLGSTKNPYSIVQQLHLKHNTLASPEGEVISLSGIYDHEGKHKISTVISQLINGWVDIAKDAWIFDIQGNFELAPVMLFLIQAGVTVEETVAFLSNPMIREYVKQERLAKSTFAKALNKAPKEKNLFRVFAKAQVLTDPRFGFNLDDPKYDDRDQYNNVHSGIDRVSSHYTQKRFINIDLASEYVSRLKDPFTLEDLEASSKKTEGFDTKDRAIFVHFLQVLEMANAVKNVKMNMQFDKDKSLSLFEAALKIKNVKKLYEEGRLPKDILKKIEDESPISSFNIQPFVINLWKDFFKFKTYQPFVDFLMNVNFTELYEETSGAFKDEQDMINTLRNDFISFAFQYQRYSVDNFDKNKPYRSLFVENYDPDKVPEELKIVKQLKYGAIVMGNKLYVDHDYIKKRWNTLKEQTINLTSSQFKAKYFMEPSRNFFVNYKGSKENGLAVYYRYTYEREYLRSVTSFTSFVNSKTKDIYIQKLIDLKIISKNEADPDTEHYTRIINYAFNMYLSDAALINILEPSLLFQGELNFAEVLFSIKEMYPEELKNYPVFDYLNVNKKGKFVNLKLSSPFLETDVLEVVHNNIENLADPTVKKVDNAFDNTRISNIFSVLAFYSFLQTGQDVKNYLSLARVIADENLKTVLMESLRALVRKKDSKTFNELLEAYLIQFKQNYMNFKKDNTMDPIEETETKVIDTRRRYKKYNLVSIEKKTVRDIKPLDYNPELHTYTIKEKADALGVPYDSVIDAFIKFKEKVDNKSVLVYDTALGGPSSIEREKGVFYSMVGNIEKIVEKRYPHLKDSILGIPTKKTFRASTAIANERMVDTEYENNVKLINEALDKLEALKEDGYTLIFPEEGLGLALLNYDGMNKPVIKTDKTPLNIASAPRTYMYLTNELFRRFNFINPVQLSKELAYSPRQAKVFGQLKPLEMQEEFNKFVISKQPITHEDVLRKLKECLDL